jgi:hypothetical protein
MLGLPYSLKTILHEMRGLFIPIWLCLAKIDEVEMFVKARNFLILGLDIIGREPRALFEFLKNAAGCEDFF